MTDDATLTLSLDDARALAEEALRAGGCDDENARAVADIMIRAEADGCASHGLFRLPGYMAALESGKVDGAARPEITHLLPSVLRVDGHCGFAPLALEQVRPALIDAARTYGLAAASIIRAHHFSALWCEVEPLAEAGLCTFACTAYLPAMAPHGGYRALFGTNPMAFGWPRAGKPPMVFDQASAAMARGEVMIAARDGQPVPEGVGLDADGHPTTDPNAILDGGVLLPFGGHKGSAIAMLVELLAAGLTGDRFSYEAAEADNGDGGPPRGGEFLLAIDPSKFGDPGWLKHTEAFFDRLSAIPGTRLPGQRRHDNRARTAVSGIQMPSGLIQTIMEKSGKI